MYKHFIKRLLDLVFSVMAILLFAIPMLIIAIITKLDSPGPILFRQQRIGRHKKTFTILKFRSMPTSAPKDTPTHLLHGTEKLTKWQRFIRRASIDELPQLFNILVGHMSLVGPRPALWNQEDLLAERDRYGANDVRPGLTGWAQINGRDELDVGTKAKLDGVYTQRLNQGRFHGFAMDMTCFFRTFGVVLRSDGVVEGSMASATKGDRHE
ncbi:MAG: sugar transferase [Clostridia bacterium]|nr:sugar transferase [Clostridia bacterium]